MTCPTTPTTTLTPIGTRLAAGAIGGIAGGVIFGTMMHSMGMITMIAGMMGSTSPAVGWGIHMMMSLIFGLILGALLPWFPSCLGQGISFAMAYGVALWIIGPLVAMPMMMGMPVLSFTETSTASLMGHVVFAVVAFLVARVIISRR